MNFISIQKDGNAISWQHLINLYEHDKGKGTGLTMVPKLKFEHVHLTPFAKMRVDLAVQVSLYTLHVCTCITITIYYVHVVGSQ